MPTITVDTKKSDIQPAISAITKIFRKYHLNYDQIHYATKVARKNVGVQRNKTPKQKIDRLSKDDQKKLIRNIVKAENLDAKKFSPQLILFHIDQWKNKGCLPKDVKLEKTSSIIKSVLKVYGY